jgi:hypothetical protein
MGNADQEKANHREFLDGNFHRVFLAKITRRFQLPIRSLTSDL